MWSICRDARGSVWNIRPSLILTGDLIFFRQVTADRLKLNSPVLDTFANHIYQLQCHIIAIWPNPINCKDSLCWCAICVEISAFGNANKRAIGRVRYFVLSKKFASSLQNDIWQRPGNLASYQKWKTLKTERRLKLQHTNGMPLSGKAMLPRNVYFRTLPQQHSFHSPQQSGLCSVSLVSYANYAKCTNAWRRKNR